jgi:hypothetical protein
VRVDELVEHDLRHKKKWFPTPGFLVIGKAEGNHNMMLRGYIDKLDLGTDLETGESNILVGSAAEYHSLPAEDKKRAWCLVKTATVLLHLGPVRIYQLASEGKLASKTIRKNPSDRKGLKVIKIQNALIDHTQARQSDKQRVLRRLKRVLRSTWWFNDNSETFLLFIVGSELQCVEAEEFGSSEEKKAAFAKRYETYALLADLALTMVKEEYGPEEAARLINNHSVKDQETKEGTISHEGNS